MKENEELEGVHITTIFGIPMVSPMKNMRLCSKDKAILARYATAGLARDISQLTTTTERDKCVGCFALDVIKPWLDSWTSKRMWREPWATLEVEEDGSIKFSAERL